jgi:hypothetical protein
VRDTLRLAVYRQSVRLGDKPLETHDQCLFLQLSTCGYSPYVTVSLTREWVCLLQLLLILASTVILWPGSRGTCDHILLSQTRHSSNLDGQVLVFLPEIGWHGYTPRQFVQFSSSPTIRSAGCSFKMKYFVVYVGS